MCAHVKYSYHKLYVTHTMHILHLIPQQTYALIKIHSRTSKKLHVSAPGCHNQRGIQNKGIQTKHANLGIRLPLLE